MFTMNTNANNESDNKKDLPDEVKKDKVSSQEMVNNQSDIFQDKVMRLEEEVRRLKDDEANGSWPDLRLRIEETIKEAERRGKFKDVFILKNQLSQLDELEGIPTLTDKVGLGDKPKTSEMDNFKKGEREESKIIVPKLDLRSKIEQAIKIAEDEGRTQEVILLKDQLAKLDDVQSDIPTLKDKVSIEIEKKKKPDRLKQEKINKESLYKNKELTDAQQEKIIKEFEVLGVTEEELSQVEGFNELSFGKKILVARNLKQFVFEQSLAKAEERFQEDNTRSGFVKRVFNSLTKRFQIARLRTASLNEILNDKETFLRFISEVSKGVKEGAPEVEIIGDKVKFDYFKDVADELNESERDVLNWFNDAAFDLSNLPLEYGYKDAGKEKINEFRNAENNFNEAKNELLKIFKDKYGEKQATLMIKDAEVKVSLTRMFVDSPGMDEAIQSIKDDNLWKKALGDILVERSGYFVAGFALRSAAWSAVGAAGLPMAASALGAYMAKKRSVEEIERMRVSARMGGEKNDITKNVSRYDVLIKRLDNFVERIKNEDDPQKKDKIVTSLNLRIDEVRRKLENGLVDFGKDSIVGQNALIDALGRAIVFAYVGDKNREAKIKDRLDRWIERSDKNISKKEKEFIKENLYKGALFGATFSTLGYLAHELASSWFGWDREVSIKKQSQPKFIDRITPSEEDVKEEMNNTYGKQNNFDVSDADSISDTSAEKTKVGNEAVHEYKASNESQEGCFYDVREGESLWKVTERGLNENTSFQRLNDAQKTWVIDAIKDRFTKLSPEELKSIGIKSGDINKVTPGEKIDFSYVLKGDVDTICQLIEKASNLSPEQINSILENNEKISEFYRSLKEAKAQNPNIKIPELNDDLIDKIIKGEVSPDDFITTKPDVKIEPLENLSQEKPDTSINTFSENLRDAIANNNVESFISHINNDLYSGIRYEIQKNGDAIIYFDVKDNSADVRLIITKDGKMAVDGYGKNNWPKEAKIGHLFSKRDTSTFVDANSENFKKALDFINKGGPLGKFDLENVESSFASDVVNEVIQQRADAISDYELGVSNLEDVKAAIANQNLEKIVPKINDDFYNGISSEISKKGDIVLSFDVKNNLSDIKLIITKDGKMAVDGYGFRNWPKGVKLGGLFSSRKLNTFADFTPENLKRALDFINKGGPISE